MARTKKQDSSKKFKFDGKEFQYTGRIYPEFKQEGKNCNITPFYLTLNGTITIKGCKLFRTDKHTFVKFPEYKSGDEYKSYIFYPEELNEEVNELAKVIEGALDK